MKKILIVGIYGRSTRIIYNELSDIYDVDVIIEDKISKFKFYKHRFKKLGLVKVIGQIIFSVYAKFYLERKSMTILQAIFNQNNLNDSPIPSDKITHVNSINSKLSRRFIKNHPSNYIIVSGTRIIGAKTLAIKDKKYLNIHAGITPRYRGVHGAYWANINNDFENIGVTLHYVDAGVDTGKIIAQSKIKFSVEDNFITYPVKQLANGLELLKNFLDNSSINKVEELINSVHSQNSRQYYHPTIWFYLYNQWFKEKN
jgi:folate-dependent phosphoribosylglycinamide formyltransferase PurN